MTLSKAVVVVIFATLLVTGVMAVRYFGGPETRTVKETIQPSLQPTFQPTAREPYCAKAGEMPVNNLDLTTGKRNPNIKIKDCCSGLEKIGKKQSGANRDSDLCGQTIGASDDICSPCGNGLCDSQYEDNCNCPEDCK